MSNTRFKPQSYLRWALCASSRWGFAVLFLVKSYQCNGVKVEDAEPAGGPAADEASALPGLGAADESLGKRGAGRGPAADGASALPVLDAADASLGERGAGPGADCGRGVRLTGAWCGGCVTGRARSWPGGRLRTRRPPYRCLVQRMSHWATGEPAGGPAADEASALPVLGAAAQSPGDRGAGRGAGCGRGVCLTGA